MNVVWSTNFLRVSHVKKLKIIFWLVAVPKGSKMATLDSSTSYYTFAVNSHPANHYKGNKVTLEDSLRYIDWYDPTSSEVIVTTINEGHHAKFDHGFIGAVFEAYSNHYDLVLRPDDVWVAIMTQFSRYVENNAEALRKKFVNHDGQKKLVVYGSGSLRTADYASFARQIIDAMKEHLNQDITTWMIPEFSTTTLNDRTVESVIMMSAMQKYFSYKQVLCCGIPNVTLQGSVEDWIKLRANIDNLLQYDLEDQMNVWHKMLAKILDEFVASRQGNPDISFWNKICHSTYGGSGSSYLSGWITAFTVFESNGKPNWKTTKSLMGKTIINDIFPVVETAYVTAGVVSVPVTVDDNGTEYKTTMFAGQMFFDATTTDVGSVFKPRSDWFMALIDEKKVEERKKSPYFL